MSQAAAAKAAGFKNPRQSGSQLLTLPEYAHVKTEFEFLKAERQHALGITPQRTLERLAEIAYTDSGELYDKDGSLKNFTKLSRAQRSLIREVKTSWSTVKVYHEATDEKPAWTETVIKPNVHVKLAAPETALKMLAKHQGLLVERVQINITEKAEQAKRDVDALFDRAITMAAEELTEKAKTEEAKIAQEVARAIALAQLGAYQADQAE